MVNSLRKAAKFGPVSAIIRQKMAERGLEPNTLAEQFDNSSAAAANISVWLNAKGAPGPKYKQKLSEILSIDPRDLEPKVMEISVPIERIEKSIQEPKTKLSEALHIIITSEGNVTIRLNLTLAQTQGFRLAKALMAAIEETPNTKEI